MKKANFIMFGIIILISTFAACTKDSLVKIPGNPGNPGNENPPPVDPGSPPPAGYTIKVKATIGIGSVLYDSIPAKLQVTSWDSLNNPHQKEVELSAGTNTITLPKADTRYELKLSKWGITDGITFTKEQISEGTVISLGGTKTAKKLTKEESFVFAEGSYRPDGRTEYNYNESGSVSKITFFRKKPQYPDLVLYTIEEYNYKNNVLDRIDVKDETNSVFGFTTFTYDQHLKIIKMHQKRYDQLTDANVYYQYPSGYAEIKVNYAFSNGQGMQYTMKFKGGNKVQDLAVSTTGGSEGGNYSYDFNINPYLHMNMPNLFLSNSSKNNLIDQQKGYGGNIPSGIPYKYEYSYDSDGYPVVLVRIFKSYITGEHLYTIKTVYTY